MIALRFAFCKLEVHFLSNYPLFRSNLTQNFGTVSAKNIMTLRGHLAN